MIQLSRCQQLELVLVEAFRQAPHARRITFDRHGLATFGAVCGFQHSPRWWGDVLQEYRLQPAYAFRIVARGYGRNARWYVIAKANAPTARRLADSREQQKNAAQDAIKREAADLDHEVLPSLQINTAGKAEMRMIINAFEHVSYQRLTDAGVPRADAIVWLAPVVDPLRERWAV